MSTTIHDRVKIIKNEQDLDTTGGGDFSVPAHGSTHVATGSDPVPPEIDGITADMSGIADGEVPAYDLATNTFLPGSGSGSVTLEQARTAGNQYAGDVDYADNDIVDIQSIGFKNGQSINWNIDEATLDVITGIGGTVIQVGMETLVPVWNATGVDIPDGSVVYPTGGITNNLPEVALAQTDSHETVNVAYGLATGLIANGTEGRVCLLGRVRDIDTSGVDLGPVYISDTVAGGLTSTPPSFPNYTMLVGVCIKKDATTGAIIVDRNGDPKLTVIDSWNGTFRESFDFRTSSNGTIITGSLEPSNGHPNMTMMFSDGFTTLDTTPPVTVALTPGSDTIPQTNYVFILQSAKVLAVSTSDWPTVEHIRVARIVLKSAATCQLEGSLGNQNWNDHVADTTSFQGHMSHIGAKLRQFDAQWKAGVEGSSDITTNVVTLQNTAGIVYQLHRHTFPNKDTRQFAINLVTTGTKTFVVTSAIDLTSIYPVGKLAKVNGSTGNDGLYTVASTSWSTPNFSIVVDETIPDGTVDGTIGDDASVVNDSASPFVNVSDLTDLTLDASGDALNNTSFSMVVWGVANKSGEVSHLMLNLPTGTYNKNFPEDAETDAQNYSVFDIPKQFQGIGFLIARHTYVNNGGTWTLHATEDLRGKVPNSTAGGGGGGSGVTSYLGLLDTDSSYSSQAGKRPQVNAGETALEFVDNGVNDLTDATVTTPADGDILEYNSTSALWENVEKETTEFYGTTIEELLATRDKLGQQLMDDSDCEDSGVTAWTVSSSATLTKTGASLPPDGGNQSLKIAYNGVAGAGAYQVKTVVGKRYLVSFWARGDGTNGGSAVGGRITIAASADWVPYFLDYVASATSVGFATVNVAGAYIQIDNVNLWQIRDDIPVDGKHYRESYLENLMTYSEHFTAASSNWVNSLCTINENSGMLSSLIDRDTGLFVEMEAIVSDVTSGTHYLSYTVTGAAAAKSTVFAVLVKAGTYDKIALLDSVGNSSCYIDVNTGLVNSTGGNFEDVEFRRLPGGEASIKMQFLLTSTSTQVRVYVLNSSFGASFAGDAKDGIYITGTHFYTGTLADDLPYVKTTTAAETGRQEFLLEKSTVKEDRTKLGLLERIVQDKPSGIFETPQNNVLYVAPDHIQHRGHGDLVYAQPLFGDGVSGDVSANIASNKYPEKLIGVEGGGLDYNNYWYPMGYYLSSTEYLRAYLNMNGTIDIARGSLINGTSDYFDAMFYFTLQEKSHVILF